MTGPSIRPRGTLSWRRGPYPHRGAWPPERSGGVFSSQGCLPSPAVSTQHGTSGAIWQEVHLKLARYHQVPVEESEKQLPKMEITPG